MLIRFAAAMILCSSPALAQQVISPDTIYMKDGTSSGLIDLRSTGNRPHDGFFSSKAGAYIDFCSATGCLENYPGLLAQTLIQATTRVDNAQEVAFHTKLLSRTGYSPNWQRNTQYTNALPSQSGQVSLVLNGGGFAGNLYKNVSGSCTSATTGDGPQGTDPNTDIVDGSCRWRWYADGLNAGKSNLSVATDTKPGAGQTWGIVTAFNASAGIGDAKMFPHEWDCNNFNKDSNFGSNLFMNCFYMGGGGPNTFPMFSAFYFDNGNRGINGGAGYNHGLYFSGSKDDAGTLIKEAVLVDVTKAKYTIHGWPGVQKEVFLKDDSSSTTVLQATGFHTYGVDLSNAVFNSGVPLALPTNGFISFKNGLGATLGYAGNRLQYGPNTATSVFSIDDAGNTQVSGGISVGGGVLTPAVTTTSMREPQPFTIPSSTAGCTIGQHAWDQNYEYRCVADNTWKRIRYEAGTW